MNWLAFRENDRREQEQLEVGRALIEDATKDTARWLQAGGSAEERIHVLAMQDGLAELARIVERGMERRRETRDDWVWSETVTEVLGRLEKASELRGNIVGNGLVRLSMCLPRELLGWKVHLVTPSASPTWRAFQNRFIDLAREEQGRADVITMGKVLRRMDHVLRVCSNYEKHPEGWERGKPEQGMIGLIETPPHGVWNYASDGISENFFERVRLCVAEAGRALPDYPKGSDPEDFWLHRLCLDLLRNKSDLLWRPSETSRWIFSVCVASATFCARLQREALTDGNQAEPSPAQNSTKSAPNEQNLRDAILKKKTRIVEIECALDRPQEEASRLRLGEEREGVVTEVEELEAELREALVDRAIASRKRMLESFGMPEEARNANLPPALDAQKSRALLGIELARLEHLRRGVWKKFFDEARISDLVKTEWQSALSMRKMPDPGVDLGLTFALTKEYEKAISRASAQLADLLATAAGSRINQAQLREAIWRECLDFACQLGQWDAFTTWVGKVVHVGWRPIDADGQDSLAPDSECEKRLQERRNFFEGRIGMYSREWLSAIDEAIELRLTVSAAHAVNASGETGKQAKAAETKSPRIDPEVAKRAALVKANPGIPADEICETFDRENVPLPTRWLAAGLQTWSRAYKNSDYRSRIDTLISKDRAR